MTDGTSGEQSDIGEELHLLDSPLLNVRSGLSNEGIDSREPTKTSSSIDDSDFWDIAVYILPTHTVRSTLSTSRCAAECFGSTVLPDDPPSPSPK